ncbi:MULTISPECIES: hypothetical protein [Xenorhabdus]|uniref:hypothetical protein n=1 Tax=Xenorhabdus TaxID=626 RepID=UPI00068A5AB1|nr:MULTISPECIES: hypothetical protein [Xenorhabdus]
MKNPNLIPKPFAQSEQKNDIPANHKSDQPSQKATWDTGFPQITMMPVTAGGLPPSGRDFNGILNQISDNIVHLSKGGKFKYSQEYADLIGGYPKGAILQSDDETREFQSLADNNKINFNKEPSEKINAAWKQVSTTQILDELNKKLNRSDVVQSVGSSKTQVMSQNAVTDALNTKQDKGDYATNPALNEVRKQANTANQNAVNANDNANRRLDKAQNGADIPDKGAFVDNLGLRDTVKQAQNAFPRTGGVINGNVDVTGYLSSTAVYEAGGIRVYSPINKPTPDDIGAYPKTGGVINGNVDVTGNVSGNGIYEAGGVRVYSPNNPPTEALLETNGWYRDTVNGVIIQWGNGIYSDGQLVKFPRPFSPISVFGDDKCEP